MSTLAVSVAQLYHGHMSEPDAGVSLSEMLDAARVAVSGIPGGLWQASGAELAEVARALDAVGAAVRGAIVAVAAEAVLRGETQSSQSGSLLAWRTLPSATSVPTTTWVPTTPGSLGQMGGPRRGRW